ncbi:MAG TPA: hypothetical protein VF044_10675 [Actinomycetota bacterium]
MTDEGRGRRRVRGALAVALLAGVVIGALQLTPVGAHVSGTVAHLWRDHIRPKTDARYVRDNELLWAVVAPDGSLVRGSNVTSSAKLDPGTYEVVFARDVSGCAYAGNVEHSSVSGEVLVEPLFLEERGVFVTTYTSAGSQTDKRFHLIVACG